MLQLGATRNFQPLQLGGWVSSLEDYTNTPPAWRLCFQLGRLKIPLQPGAGLTVRNCLILHRQHGVYLLEFYTTFRNHGVGNSNLVSTENSQSTKSLAQRAITISYYILCKYSRNERSSSTLPKVVTFSTRNVVTLGFAHLHCHSNG